jgi:hypothetical protein
MKLLSTVFVTSATPPTVENLWETTSLNIDIKAQPVKGGADQFLLFRPGFAVGSHIQ